MSPLKDWTGYAESVEEALKRGLKKLGLTRDDVQMDILSERTSSLFSMMDYRRVKVKLTPKPGVQPATAKGPRFEDRRSRDERPGRRPDRDKNFRDRPDRDRNPQRKDSSRDQQQNRGQDRRRDQKSFGSRDQRQDNQDRRRDNRPSRDQNRPPQNRQQENRRQPFSQQRDRNRPPSQSQNIPRPQMEASAPPPSTEADLPEIPLDFKRPVPVERPEQSTAPAEHNLSAPASPGPQKELRPMDPSTLETQLSRWKEILGWEDLSWSVNPAEGRRLPINLSTAKAERLMGPGGGTLEAFEYLFNLLLTQSVKDAPTVQFVMEGFENPKNQRIIDLANRAAAEVRRSRTVYRMDPMPSADRKIVHQALANEADVETVSEGEGPFRKVVVRLKPGASSDPKPGTWKR